MAIEIESESQKEKSELVKYTLYVGVALLLIVGISYGVLFFSVKRSEQKVASLEKQLDEQITEEDEALEDKISEAQGKIERSGRLIKQHKAPSNFFEFLEKNTHPKLRFDETDLNVKAGRAKLGGTTESFTALGQQVNLLQNKEMVKSVDVSGAHVESGGEVNFELLLLLNSDIFKFTSE